jgi:hypothetical protein
MGLARNKSVVEVAMLLCSQVGHFVIIGASRSEPHTNQYYEKIAVLMYLSMYLCLYVAIRRPRVYHARARALNALQLMR